MIRKLLVLLILLFPGIATAQDWPGNCTQLFHRITSPAAVQSLNPATVTLNTSTGYFSYSYLSYQDANMIGVEWYSAFWDSDQSKWVVRQSLSVPMKVTDYDALVASQNSLVITANTDAARLAAKPACSGPCTSLANTSNYDLQSHLSNQTPSTGNACYEDCKQDVEILWTDCINDNCVSSVKYTYTGESCSAEPVVTDLNETPPTRCNDELDAKIAACGGSLNVQSFDFETCSGVCAPDDCHSAWLAKINECGGIMGVSTWSSDTCTGTCASDYRPDITDPADGVSPGQIDTGTTQNSDGTTTITTTTTYNYQGTDYTEIKTITYDSQGNPINTTITTNATNGPGQGSDGQLAVLQDIRDKLEEFGEGSPPNLPAQPEYDGTIPDTKNWTEYDNAQEIGVAKANREIDRIEQQTTQDPFTISLDTSGSTPYLHGPMFGTEVYIRFDRPWMLTGYQIMNATLIGIGYLQAALMVHRVVTGA